MKEKVYSARAWYQTTVEQIFQSLSATYAIEEVRYMTLMLMEHYLQLKRNDILLDRQFQLDANKENQLRVAIARICKEEPIQYVIGETFFYGRSFFVSPAVLIPRRETEELVDIIVKSNTKEGLKVLDIGTGSGCIAITLNQEMNSPYVEALDASQEALAVAKANAGRYNADIQWYLEDILAPNEKLQAYDLVVSNPPYVKESEKQQMQNNVLKYEPYQALFVEDHDPLLFYRQIANLCKEGMLKNGGRLYFEINEAHSKELVEMLKSIGFREIEEIKDLQQKDRFVCAMFTF